MDFISEAIEKYCEDYSEAEDEVLAALNRETRAKFLWSRMLSGHLQGKLLKMISHMIKPENILEIGTYTSYSAICLASGLRDTGILHTIEKNPEFEDIIRRYVHRAQLEDKIKLYIGNAIDIVPTLDFEYDLVFIDADKEHYVDYYELVIEKVRRGGFILVDNVLWDGKVLNKEPRDVETKAIQTFNKRIVNDKRVENFILPLRDGLMLIRKK